MTPERPVIRRPHEIFGFTEEEVTQWRISTERFQEIIANPNTRIHSIKICTNQFGKFMFLTTSRGMGQNHTRMTFYGLGYHEYRERWIQDEWFWYQSQADWGGNKEQISLEDAQAQIAERHNELSPFFCDDEQSEHGRLFERLADMTDDDAALAEMQDMGCSRGVLFQYRSKLMSFQA